MNVFELLKNDHVEVSELLNKMLNKKDTHNKTVNKLKFMLEQHKQFEEKELYPELKKYDQTKLLIETSYKDHDLVDKLLNEIDKAAAANEDITAKISELKDDFEDHVEVEETELFVKAIQLLDESTINKLTENLLQIKKKSS